jgi:hypothetical protein
VNARITARATGFVASALVFAQVVRPGLDWYHTWQYSALLAIAAVILFRAGWNALRKRKAPAAKTDAVAFAGALVVTISGIASGLLGPDTVTVTGAPGTVTPLADLGAAAFFPQTEADGIARGDAAVRIRRQDGGDQTASLGRNPYIGTSIAYVDEQPAAYIVARDNTGNRLTVTQPSNTAFLSPVLLFPNHQDIRGIAQPLDTFATPALHRIWHAIYFTPDQARTFAGGSPPAPALVVSAADDSGKSLGVGLLRSGDATHLAGATLTATIGRYPRLLIASAPHPIAMIGGLLLFIGGLAGGIFSTARRSRNETSRILPPA